VHVFRIGTASRLSGIDAMTLRNWERRYGVVVASRGPGGQRLYSLEELDRLRWLRSRIEAGLSPGEGHALLRETLRRGKPSLSGSRVREESQRLRTEAADARTTARALRRTG
jgi:DNA-binding transcriptional MerR regulator